LATLAISSLVCAAALEGALRLTRDPQRFYPYHRSALEVFHPSEAITPGVSGVSYFSTNSFGTRGPEPDGERVRILTVGGSTTACTVLDDSEAWPALLMRYLDEDANDPRAYWVGSSAIDGHNSQHHLMHALYLLPEIPDLDYVLLYAGLNDMGAWLYEDRFDPHYLDDPRHWARRLGQAFRVSRYTPDHWPWYKHLETWKRASALKSRVKSLWIARQRDAGRIEQDAGLRWIEGQRARRAKVEKKPVPRAKLDTLPLALDAYGANLAHFIAAARQAGVEPIFVAQAIQARFANDADLSKLWMGAMDGGAAYLGADDMVELLSKFNERMREVATREKVAFIDLPALLDEQNDLYYDGIHFNENGARAAARSIASELAARVFASSPAEPR
jgi:lysophospholipase L1-like esterase